MPTHEIYPGYQLDVSYHLEFQQKAVYFVCLRKPHAVREIAHMASVVLTLGALGG